MGHVWARWAAGASLVMLLAACGTTSAGSNSEQPLTANADADATPGTTAHDGFPRTVSHAMGDTTISDQPGRVVVLDTGELDSAAALGVEPVGAVRAPVDSGLLDYLSPATDDTELVGTIDEPDLEAIAALRPDLILSSQLRHEQLYDELSAIAPTVFTETVGVAWKDNFAVHAEALGRDDQASEMLDDYRARSAATGERLAADGALPTVSIVRFVPGEIRLYAKESFIGTILDDVGLPRPEVQDVDEFDVVIGPEQVAQMDGDVIFYGAYGPPEDTDQVDVTAGPLWDSLSAVQAGRAYQVPDDHWFLGIGITAANHVLDDLDEILQ